MSDSSASPPPVVPEPKKRKPGTFMVGDPRTYRGGRPPGHPNKNSENFKETVLEAVRLLGGARGLVEWTQKDPANETLFWTDIAPRVLPRIIEGNPDAPIPLQVIERRVISPPTDILDVDVVDVTEEDG